MGTMPSAPDFTGRTPIQFICDANPTLSITKTQNTLYNNPKKMFIHAGNVAKVDMGINGTNYIRGDGEFAPFQIDLEWDQLGWNDYLALTALKPYPLTFISIRNNGFYGKLYFDGPNSENAKVSDVISLKAQFFVLAPSDDGPNGVGGAGAANAINRVDTSAMNLVVTTNSGGFIPANSNNYYWVTFSTKWGETAPVSSGLITSATANTENTITFSWPTSTGYVIKASIYCANVNDPTQSKLVAELLSSDTPIWYDLVGYAGLVVNQQPPAVSTAYRGTYQGAVWFNEVP